MDAPFTSTARRLAIDCNNFSHCTSLKSSTPRLRSVLIHTQVNAMLYREKLEKFLYGGFKLLRVLDLHGVEIKELPSEIGGLIHLRYLGCTKTRLKRLPSSMANLHNLQSLIITTHEHDFIIPSGMMKIQQLRHFHAGHPLSGFYNKGRCVTEGHPRIDGTSNLQTLTMVKAGEWMHGCFGKLTNLRKLGICLLGQEAAYHDVFYESIVKLEFLESLLVSGYKLPVRYIGPPKLSKLRLFGKLEKLLEATEFPTNLTKLTFRWNFLEQDPMVTLEKLKNLRILRLDLFSYSGVTMACSAGGFPRLESLHLEVLTELEEWRVEEGAMPNLLHLQIYNCQKLKELPEGLQHVTTLKRLELWGLNTEIFKARLKENEGEDSHKIHHIPSIDISYRENS